jgi:hypothetical protein
MTVVLALIAVFVPASVTLVGYWFRQQSQKRLEQEQKQSKDRLAAEHEQSERRLDQQQKQENDRLKLDAAIRAADLFAHGSADAVANAARSASGLLALTRLGFADLSVALLVDLWSPKASALPEAGMEASCGCGRHLSQSPALILTGHSARPGDRSDGHPVTGCSGVLFRGRRL